MPSRLIRENVDREKRGGESAVEGEDVSSRKVKVRKGREKLKAVGVVRRCILSAAFNGWVSDSATGVLSKAEVGGAQAGG